MSAQQKKRLVEIVETIAASYDLSEDLVIHALTYTIVQNEIADQVAFLRDEGGNT